MEVLSAVGGKVSRTAFGASVVDFRFPERDGRVPQSLGSSWFRVFPHMGTGVDNPCCWGSGAVG